MAGNRKDKESGLYYFNRSQLVILGGAFTLSSVLVFLLGIWIGQGIEERKLLKQEEPLVKVPLQPLAPGGKAGQGTGKDELTFYDTLGKSATGAQPSQTVKDAQEAEKAAKADASPSKEPEFKGSRVEAKPAAKETKSAKKSAAPENAAQKTKEKAAPAEDKPELAQKSADDEKSKTDGAQRVWTVQVNAFPDETRAQKLVERLKQKGYDAYVVQTNIKGKDWYRVRVGHFPSRGQAKGMVEELQTKENFTNAMAVSR